MTHDPERIRTAARALFADVYGEESGPARRRVAYKNLANVPDDLQADILANDLLRGGYAEAVLRTVLGDTLNALMLHLRAGDVAKVRRLLAETPLDGPTVAKFVGTEARTVASNIRLDLNNPGGAKPSERPPVSAGTSIADTIQTVFESDGDTRKAGIHYLRELNSADAVEPLLAIAGDADASERNRVDALRLLGILGQEAALPALREITRSAETVRIRGVALAAQIALTGTHDGILTGVVADWAAHNPKLALSVVTGFGDVSNNDDFLVLLLRGEGTEREQTLAACALAMSGNTDYAAGLIRFLGDDATRWERLLAVETTNPEPRITDLFADKLRDTSYGLRPSDDTTLILGLVAAVGRFNNERGAATLRSVAGNIRLPHAVREAAQAALEQ